MRPSIRFAATALILAFGVGAADAKRFAVRCIGKAVSTWSIDGGKETRSVIDVNSVYVIDEEAKTVKRALFPRQEFDNLCWGSLECRFSTSPGLIQYSMSGIEHEHVIDYKYEFDRINGKARITKSNDSVDGRFPGKQVENLVCTPTAIPVFDTSKNKF